MAYYDDMSEGAALNYLAGLEDAGDLAALRQLALDISAGTVAGALSVSGAITGGSTGAFTGAVTAAGVTSSAAVQAAAASGFVVGASGPKILSGTGSPEGVVTAPVGSTWTDTAATTGAIRWVKATGTGNTGWVVEYGDTGNRNLVAESLSNGWTASTFRLRRVGSTVTITLHLFGPAASGAAVYTLPSGFRPPAIYLTVTPYGVSADSTRVVELTSGGAVSVYNYGAAYTHYWSATWQTTDAWPSSLPGSAA